MVPLPLVVGSRKTIQYRFGRGLSEGGGEYHRLIDSSLPLWRDRIELSTAPP